MTTYLLRHASTQYSADHRVNGDPTVELPLDTAGQVSCRTGAGIISAIEPEGWVVSSFARTSETARRLMGGADTSVNVEPALDELDYGQFEGGPYTAYARWLVVEGPWECPPGARESQRQAIRRMLVGLLRTTASPSPRLVVAHGLLSSVLRWLGRTLDGIVPALPLFFDEVPCLYLIKITDAELEAMTSILFEALEAEERDTVAAGRWIMRLEDERVLATFDGLPVQQEEKNSHA
ncbi:histidine phosphatase family protein [Streptomyces tateyamensis]|uniref:Histidine phosphatase family protein n=1 Tax=Streptomyces tateyamensis TaxID=565073 RepID=A0A2V4NLL2_9ACTN|nr:histidine phosphatase family protein [Streptomyces tateyamensis]PYC80533.1 histidine phosphatase family protein [Streptomyces tateyamensis]